MRKTALCVAVLFLAAIALPMAGEHGEKKDMGTTHEVTTTVVSVDIEAKTITFKDDEGNEKTAPVLAEGLGALKKVKAGEKVVLTCRDMDGEHEGVTDIKKAKS